MGVGTGIRGENRDEVYGSGNRGVRGGYRGGVGVGI